MASFGKLRTRIIAMKNGSCYGMFVMVFLCLKNTNDYAMPRSVFCRHERFVHDGFFDIAREQFLTNYFL